MVRFGQEAKELTPTRSRRRTVSISMSVKAVGARHSGEETERERERGGSARNRVVPGSLFVWEKVQVGFSGVNSILWSRFGKSKASRFHHITNRFVSY